MPQIKANGIFLEFDTHGRVEDPAMILIRGLGSQMTYWPTSLINGLVAQGIRVVTFDNRDVGLSQKFEDAGVPDVMAMMAQVMAGETPEAPYVMADMIDDVIGLMDALEIERAHLMGISMGGMIAQATAARYPERVLSLASIMSSSGAPDLPGATPEAQATLMSSPPTTDRETVIEHAIKGHRVVQSPSYPEPDAFLYEVFGGGYDRCYCPQGVARQLAAVVAGAGQDRSARLATIQAPTLVVHGDADLLIPLACGVDTAEKIPGARLEIIEGMGHDVPRALMPKWVELLVENARDAV